MQLILAKFSTTLKVTDYALSVKTAVLSVPFQEEKNLQQPMGAGHDRKKGISKNTNSYSGRVELNCLYWLPRL